MIFEAPGKLWASPLSFRRAFYDNRAGVAKAAGNFASADFSALFVFVADCFAFFWFAEFFLNADFPFYKLACSLGPATLTRRVITSEGDREKRQGFDDHLC